MIHYSENKIILKLRSQRDPETTGKHFDRFKLDDQLDWIHTGVGELNLKADRFLKSDASLFWFKARKLYE